MMSDEIVSGTDLFRENRVLGSLSKSPLSVRHWLKHRRDAHRPREAFVCARSLEDVAWV